MPFKKGKDKNKAKPFDKGETANAGGRPFKLFTDVNFELKEMGYAPLTHSQLLDGIQTLFNLDEEMLKMVADNKRYPWSLRVIAERLLSVKYRGEAVEQYLDRAFGKPNQSVNAKVDNVTSVVINRENPINSDKPIKE